MIKFFLNCELLCSKEWLHCHFAGISIKATLVDTLNKILAYSLENTKGQKVMSISH